MPPHILSVGAAYYAAEARQSSASTREMLERRIPEPIRYSDGNSVTVMNAFGNPMPFPLEICVSSDVRLQVCIIRHPQCWRVKAETPWFVNNLFQGEIRGRPRQGPQIQHFNQGWKVARSGQWLEFSCEDGVGACYEHDRGEGGAIRGKGSGPEEYMSTLL